MTLTSRNFGVLCVVAFATTNAAAAPAVDNLLCKRVARSTEGKKVALGLTVRDANSATSPDGSKVLRAHPDTAKKGFLIVDVKTSKSRTVHNKDREYDCDMVIADDGTAAQARWLGNDVVFAHGQYCLEHVSKPFLASATGKFIGYLKLGDTNADTEYRFAPLEGTTWAMAVYDHELDNRMVVTFDAKTAKITSTKKLTEDAVAKLPECK